MVLSAIKLVEVDKGDSLDEGEVLVILQKEIKSRRESIADAEKAGRSDLIADSEAEISVLEGYLPQSFSQDEIEEMAKEVIAQEEASSLQDMGKVMKVLMPKVQGRADGGLECALSQHWHFLNLLRFCPVCCEPTTHSRQT